ncbi:hypothetical protein CDL12_12225 [Handroanthus impetiginosus]|uniref:HNH domain-containing protein n=1 Tax=Handroanthus impetiginosus TaxID=429701 RepID=A0A2G9HCA0_9LAMI|nr:hypothetical protein CDL12_12225 [Handroanthus impetiginosus]
MNPNSSTKRRNKNKNKKSFPSTGRSRPGSPTGSFSPPPSAASLVDGELLTEELSQFEALQISPENASSNPRSFPYSVKQQCWDKAEKIKGRDPDRWRRDPLGNIVFRKLVGCPGCLCHDYDHIVPYSKGGKSTLENCQVLQACEPNLVIVKIRVCSNILLAHIATVNRSKGNRTELSRSDLIQKSAYCRVSGRDMDLLELSAYGNVRRAQDSGGCKIQ